jgi:hypothetical protein
MSTLGFFFLPGHVNERPLDVIVNNFGAPSWSLAHFFLISRVTFDSQTYIFKAPLFQHLLGHVTVLNVLEKSIHGGAEDGCKTKREILRYGHSLEEKVLNFQGSYFEHILLPFAVDILHPSQPHRRPKVQPNGIHGLLFERN